MRRSLLGILCFPLALAGCSGSSPVCVGDSRSPAGCGTKEVVLDPCNFLPSATSLDAAVFGGGCPSDSALDTGDLSHAVEKQTVAPDQSLSPMKDLDRKQYGFAVLLRAKDCHVIGFGCTEANLDTIKEIRVAVRNWAASNQSDLCLPATAGSCSAGATCNNGMCQ